VKRAVAEESASGGFAVVDDKGRVALPKPVRSALGIEAGSSVAWIAVGRTVLLVPQNRHLAELSARARAALAAAGLSAQDLLAALPAARADVVAETYGPELVEEIARAHADARPATSAE
jgi:AbrB family looped-hinge helix DNA binding protein